MMRPTFNKAKMSVTSSYNTFAKTQQKSAGCLSYILKLVFF